MIGLVLFALAISVQILMSTIASERLAKIKVRHDHDDAVARMWGH